MSACLAQAALAPHRQQIVRREQGSGANLAALQRQADKVGVGAFADAAGIELITRANAISAAAPNRSHSHPRSRSQRE